MSNDNPPPSWYEPPDELEIPELDMVDEAMAILKLALDMRELADIAGAVREAWGHLRPIIDADEFSYENDMIARDGGFE